MAEIKYDEFHLRLCAGIGKLEKIGDKEVIFAVCGYDMSILKNGLENVDLDVKSYEKLNELKKKPVEENLYFKWVNQDFFQCEKKEIIKNN